MKNRFVSFLKRVKSMKRAYKILLCGAVALIVVYIILGSGHSKTPFTKLIEAKAETPWEIIDVYGEDYEDLSDWPQKYGNFLSYKYSWLREKGDLIFTFSNYWETTNRDFWSLDSARWGCETDHPERLSKRIIRLMNKAYGKAEKEDGQNIWYDDYGLKYRLKVSPSSVYLILER